MSASWESLANDHILGIAPYEPGKPIEELERELGITDVIKLASNENPLPPSDRVLKAIADALPHLNRYPDGSGFYLRQALGRAPRAVSRPVHPRQRIERPDRDGGARLPPRRRGGDRPAPLVRRVPDGGAGVGRHPGGGHAAGPPARPRGDGAGHHADDQARVHRQPEQPDGDHRHRRRGRAVHGPRARPRHRGVRRGVLTSSPRARTSPTRSAT